MSIRSMLPTSLFILAVVAHQAQGQVPLIVGERQVVLTALQRNDPDLGGWPDGCMGVLRDENGEYHFYAAGPVSNGFRLSGSLDVINQRVETITITGGAYYPYKKGGPIYRDPSSGRLLLFYHAELDPPGYSLGTLWNLVGIAVSDVGSTTQFFDCGPIIEPGFPLQSVLKNPRGVDICGAPYIIRDGFFQVYFRDRLPDDTIVNTAVARAPVDEVVQAALNHQVTVWRKYYNGSFSEPGIAGLSSPIERGNPDVRWMDVAWNEAAHKYVMAVSMRPKDPDLYIAWSDDSLNWSQRTLVESGPDRAYYPTLIGLGTDPRRLGRQFYVYYQGGPDIARRLLTIPPNRIEPWAWYPLEGNARDYAGCFDGEVFGASFAEGTAGSQAASFDGTDDRIEIPCFTRDNFTLAFWVRTQQEVAGWSRWPEGYGLVDGKVNQTNSDFGTSVVFGKFAFGVGGPDTTLKSGTSINDGRWHHVAATRNGTTGMMQVYVDGTREATGTGPAGTRVATPSLYIGEIRTGGNHFEGDIDDVRIYDRVLESSEISDLRDAEPPQPDPAQFATLPTAVSSTSVTMKAAVGADSGNVVGYRFDEITGAAGGTSSGWQTDPNYTDSDLSPDTAYAYTVTMCDFAGNQTRPSVPVTVRTHTSPPRNVLPNPWRQQDVGGVGAHGYVFYENGTFTINGSGGGPTGGPDGETWGTSDEFYYVYRAANGDCELVARVLMLTETDEWTKAGVMIRDSMDGSCAFALMTVTPYSGVSFQWRTTQGGAAQAYTNVTGEIAPVWLKIVRAGNEFAGYVSANGTTWIQIGANLTISMKANATAGLCVTSRRDGTYSTAVFDNVTPQGDASTEEPTGGGPLVGRWTFDEKSGTIAADLSAYKNNGALVNGPTWTTGHLNGAVRFDGSNDYVDLPIGSVISTLSNSTFAVWANWSQTGGSWQRIFDFGTSTGVNMFVTPAVGDNGAGSMRFAITTGGASGESQLSAGNRLATGWHHVAVVINAATMTMQLYLDGSVVASTRTAKVPRDLGATTRNWLGRSQYSGDAYFSGSLDDFRIYNRALTMAEIQTAMLGGD